MVLESSRYGDLNMEHGGGLLVQKWGNWLQMAHQIVMRQMIKKQCFQSNECNEEVITNFAFPCDMFVIPRSQGVRNALQWD